MKRAFVINARGEREPFSPRKIYRSCKRARASDDLAREVTRRIEKTFYPGMRTSVIEKEIKKFLRKSSLQSAMKFSLKQAMRKLGPAGFTFEKYIGEILIRNGFRVKLNQRPKGFCQTKYEIDFFAQKEGVLYIGECKFHHLPGERVDLKVALYNYARFLDIKESRPFSSGVYKVYKKKPALVTNTKFTSEAIIYSECKGVELLGWKYPKGRGLEHLIEEQGLYPITILPSFRGYLKEIFVKARKVLVIDILEKPVWRIAKELNVREEELLRLRKEAELLMGNK